MEINLQDAMDLAVKAYKARDLEGARQICRDILAAHPSVIEAMNILGICDFELGDIERAFHTIETLLQHHPAHPRGLNSYANFLKDTGRSEEAIRYYDRVITINPMMPHAHYNRAITLLALGEMSEGWPGYVFHNEARASEAPPYRYTPWTGEKLKDHYLLVTGEQGIGDEIMYSTMLKELIAKRPEKVLVEPHARMVNLLQRSFPDAHVFTRTVPPARLKVPADKVYQCAMGHLGRWLRPNLKSFPKIKGHLTPDPNMVANIRSEYRQRFGGKKLVGIAWKSKLLEYGIRKSTPLDFWDPILSNPDCQFINLQYGDTEEEIATVKKRLGVEIYNNPDIDPMGDIDPPAAEAAALDLVISTSNTAAHIAGGVGTPTWLMLPHTGPALYWYWFINLDYSPWYGSIVPYRQHPNQTSWDSVVEKISRNLAKFAKK